MAGKTEKLLITVCITLALAALAHGEESSSNNFLDVEAPNFFSYTKSPLSQPDSLRSRPYFDFLSTLYRRDADKSSLFQPYQRTRRGVTPADLAESFPGGAVPVIPLENKNVRDYIRTRRAVVFRPLFVYKQQEIRKQELAKKKRRRV